VEKEEKKQIQIGNLLRILIENELMILNVGFVVFFLFKQMI
jgi:hypothetical protein